jgi:4a-hydroxytetrahydrobiopterin dehydratase
MEGWEEEDGALVHEFEFASFRSAIGLVVQLAEAAESANHHPDIDIRYRKVTVRWTSHDKGGITDRDRTMAERTSALAGA